MDFLNQVQFITAKPVTYLVNLSEKNFISKKSKWLPKVHAWVQSHGGEPIIPFSGAFEQKIFDMPADEQQVYCKEVCLKRNTAQLQHHLPFCALL